MLTGLNILKLRTALLGFFGVFDKSAALEYNARMYSGERPRSWALVKECYEFGKGGGSAEKGVRS